MGPLDDISILWTEDIKWNALKPLIPGPPCLRCSAMHCILDSMELLCHAFPQTINLPSETMGRNKPSLH